MNKPVRKFIPAEERHGSPLANFACGNCGQRFASKGAKRRHKVSCHAEPAAEAAFNPEADENEADENNDEDAYGCFHISPEVKARADAEWAAYDWQGRLPDGWEYRPRIDAALESYRAVRDGEANHG